MTIISSYLLTTNQLYFDPGLFVKLKVNRQQPRSIPVRPIQKIPIPIKWNASPLPEMINQICKRYSLENLKAKT